MFTEDRAYFDNINNFTSGFNPSFNEAMNNVKPQQTASYIQRMHDFSNKIAASSNQLKYLYQNAVNSFAMNTPQYNRGSSYQHNNYDPYTMQMLNPNSMRQDFETTDMRYRVSSEYRPLLRPTERAITGYRSNVHPYLFASQQDYADIRFSSLIKQSLGNWRFGKQILPTNVAQRNTDLDSIMYDKMAASFAGFSSNRGQQFFGEMSRLHDTILPFLNPESLANSDILNNFTQGIGSIGGNITKNIVGGVTRSSIIGNISGLAANFGINTYAKPFIQNKAMEIQDSILQSTVGKTISSAMRPVGYLASKFKSLDIDNASSIYSARTYDNLTNNFTSVIKDTLGIGTEVTTPNYIPGEDFNNLMKKAEYYKKNIGSKISSKLLNPIASLGATMVQGYGLNLAEHIGEGIYDNTILGDIGDFAGIDPALGRTVTKKTAGALASMGIARMAGMSKGGALRSYFGLSVPGAVVNAIGYAGNAVVENQREGKIYRELSKGLTLGQDRDPYTGEGMSMPKARQFAREMGTEAARDIFFKKEDYQEMMRQAKKFDMLTQVTDVSSLKTTMKGIRDKVVGLMQVLGSSDMEGIVKTLGKYKQLGITDNDVITTSVRNRKIMAMQAGISEQRENQLFIEGATRGTTEGFNAVASGEAAVKTEGEVDALEKILSSKQLERIGGKGSLAQGLNEIKFGTARAFSSDSATGIVGKASMKLGKDGLLELDKDAFKKIMESDDMIATAQQMFNNKDNALKRQIITEKDTVAAEISKIGLDDFSLMYNQIDKRATAEGISRSQAYTNLTGLVLTATGARTLNSLTIEDVREGTAKYQLMQKEITLTQLRQEELNKKEKELKENSFVGVTSKYVTGFAQELKNVISEKADILYNNNSIMRGVRQLGRDFMTATFGTHYATPINTIVPSRVIEAREINNNSLSAMFSKDKEQLEELLTSTDFKAKDTIVKKNIIQKKEEQKDLYKQKREEIEQML
jgi:hypothetical protein